MPPCPLRGASASRRKRVLLPGRRNGALERLLPRPLEAGRGGATGSRAAAVGLAGERVGVGEGCGVVGVRGSLSTPKPGCDGPRPCHGVRAPGLCVPDVVGLEMAEGRGRRAGAGIWAPRTPPVSSGRPWSLGGGIEVLGGGVRRPWGRHPIPRSGRGPGPWPTPCPFCRCPASGPQADKHEAPVRGGHGRLFAGASSPSQQGEGAESAAPVRDPGEDRAPAPPRCPGPLPLGVASRARPQASLWGGPAGGWVWVGDLTNCSSGERGAA